MQDVGALGRQRPGGPICASGDVGSTPHLIYELFKARAGLEWQYVPFKGDLPALMEVIAGRADFAIVTAPAALPRLASDGLRVSTVFSDGRVPALQSVPSVVELGYMDAGTQGWFAVVAPKGTPSHAIARLNLSINKALANDSVRKRLMQLGYTVPQSANTSEALEVFLGEDTERWTEVLKSRQIVGVQ
ncbi:tripartite tricarboxylate transporter substrate-binding protein [Achromobacter aloeverae]|uniref:tripartite tricarboxylate transporter substrate-binding protein n=1 Tax=Achromobacter aloeverae TaxID=1750518 RepID=UPI0013017C49|nr:tripartite tricarboxylate transporter substrate-binding protein [Achromobacter aloeverae]